MKLPLTWRKNFLEHTQSLGIDTTLFQNEIDITPSMISNKIDEALIAKKEQNQKYDRYLVSLENFLVAMGEPK